MMGIKYLKFPGLGVLDPKMASRQSNLSRRSRSPHVKAKSSAPKTGGHMMGNKTYKGNEASQSGVLNTPLPDFETDHGRKQNTQTTNERVGHSIPMPRFMKEATQTELGTATSLESHRLIVQSQFQFCFLNSRFHGPCTLHPQDGPLKV